MWDNRPLLYEDLAWIWEAFHEISTDRPVGFSAGPIPWSSLDRYAARHELSRNDFETFCTLIRALDRAWLKHSAAKQERAPAAP